METHQLFASAQKNIRLNANVDAFQRRMQLRLDG